MVVWWLAGARAVITVAVLLAAGILIAATLVARRRLIRAAEIRSVLSMGGPVTGNALRDVLRALTGDPDLDVYYRLPNREEYVTSAGEPAPWRGWRSANPGRQLIGAGTVDEQGFAALVETAVSADRASRTLRRTVLEAATPALENARLQATLRRQVLDLASARSQTVRAFLAERRRLEGQLHDGTQACLYEARSQVRSARLQVSDPAAAGSIEAAATTLGDAIAELRTLVRGIYPAGLRETGLGDALFTATHDLPLVVEIADDEDIGLDEVVATAGFFTGMDVLQIAVRSGAHGATVRISAVPDRARLRIEYTPADPPGASSTRPAASGPDEADAWLAVEDRVRALDGTMQVIIAGVAVIVEVELPCASLLPRTASSAIPLTGCSPPRDTKWSASPGAATSCSRT
jgi:signal transduction histidine kinase